jgi:hypothetical protein
LLIISPRIGQQPAGQSDAGTDTDAEASIAHHRANRGAPGRADGRAQ